MKVEVSIHGGTVESRDLFGRIQRAIGLTERLNRIPFSEPDAIRQAWSELTGTAVDATFSLIVAAPIAIQRNVWLGAVPWCCRA